MSLKKKFWNLIFGNKTREQLETELRGHKTQIGYWTQVIDQVRPIYPWYREELAYHAKQAAIISQQLERMK